MSELIAVFTTSRGPIRVALRPDKAPVTVASFVNLVRRGFYDGLSFHRVIPDFMVQGGCPEGSGRGGPGYRFEDECSPDLPHERGVLSMANAGPRTNGSQFFITHVETSWLNGKHTVFGKVVSDEDQAVVDAIQGGDAIEKVEIQGDAEAVLAAQADRVAEWNQALDAR
ncbi:MAG: peptidylprolyl isomerase [Lysobacteraceae bacterium]